MSKGADISEDDRYRYTLWRIWDEEKPFVLFIMLNPSTADDFKDDPTIRKCIAYAKNWGYGGIYIGNIYAYRTAYPEVLFSVPDPVGPSNDDWLSILAKSCAVTVAGWGNGKISPSRLRKIQSIFPTLFCLEISKNGNPKHPLYLRKNLKPIPYKYPI